MDAQKFCQRLLRLDDDGLLEESGFLNETFPTFELEKFEIGRGRFRTATLIL